MWNRCQFIGRLGKPSMPEPDRFTAGLGISGAQKDLLDGKLPMFNFLQRLSLRRLCKMASATLGRTPESDGVINELVADAPTLAVVIPTMLNSKPPVPMSAQERFAMTASCQDAAGIPKVRDAGLILDLGDRKVQCMHEGSLVVAGGYHGEWMSRIIGELRGHHEPQEELLFHEILKHVAENSCIVELGAFWAYYTNWYLGSVEGSTAVCVEPDTSNMSCGQLNLALNHRTATWINAAVGSGGKEVLIKRASDGSEVMVPCLNMDEIRERAGFPVIEVLHLDVQGAELDLLRSLDNAVAAQALRFVFVSTHHASISGSPTTHQDCIRELQRLGAIILEDHSVEESFSGDGLVVASFRMEDAGIQLPPVSRNTARNSLFGDNLMPAGLAENDNGAALF
jgi:FkbM family methyltransferase